MDTVVAGGCLVVATIAAAAVACRKFRSVGDAIFATLWSSLSHEVDRSLQPYKEKIFMGTLKGKILEIGSGTGVNLRFYQSEATDIQSLTMIEPNPHLYKILRKAVSDTESTLSYPINTICDFFPTQTVAQQQFDVIVCVLVLCSVQDLEATIAEVYQLLKPGGRFIFLEHVCPPQPSLKYSVARLIGPLWTSFGDGCVLTRQTEDAIRQLPWKHVDINRFNKKAKGLERLASHGICGHTIK